MRFGLLRYVCARVHKKRSCKSCKANWISCELWLNFKVLFRGKEISFKTDIKEKID